MFRRMILSAFGGVVLAVMFASSQTATAACEGRCPDTMGGLQYDSCLVTYSCPPDAPCMESNIRCFYTGVEIID